MSVDTITRILETLPEEAKDAALAMAILTLAAASQGGPRPPKSTPLQVLIGLFGALGIRIKVATSDEERDALIKYAQDHGIEVHDHTGLPEAAAAAEAAINKAKGSLQ